MILEFLNSKYKNVTDVIQSCIKDKKSHFLGKLRKSVDNDQTNIIDFNLIYN